MPDSIDSSSYADSYSEDSNFVDMDSGPVHEPKPNFRPSSPLPTPPHPPLPSHLDGPSELTSWKTLCELAARDVVSISPQQSNEPSDTISSPRLHEASAVLSTAAKLAQKSSTHAAYLLALEIVPHVVQLVICFNANSNVFTLGLSLLKCMAKVARGKLDILERSLVLYRFEFKCPCVISSILPLL